MQPLTVLTGILFGSSAAIAFGLAVSTFVSLAVARDAPALASELGALWRQTLVFLGLAGVCACGFLGLVKHTPWRWYAQAAMWVGLSATVAFYWPS
jgi:hypothetical protein